MKSLVLGLYAITPLHPGSGSEISVIDLPIQRERHTGFPVIWGQSLKGALRSAFESLGVDEGIVHSIFGPPTNRASDHAGAISVGDAKILLFPVRSAKGVFAYVTSPIVLERFKRDTQLAGRNVNFDVPKVEKGNALVTNNSEVKNNGKVVLEELVLDVNGMIDEKILKAIELVLPEGVDVSRRLVIVHDDVFSTFVRLSTEIVARVVIDASKGAVKQGGLWYEEFLPSDTLLCSVIIIDKPKGGTLKNEAEVEENLRDVIENKKRKYLQVGGDETVGKGFVLAKLG